MPPIRNVSNFFSHLIESIESITESFSKTYEVARTTLSNLPSEIMFTYLDKASITSLSMASKQFNKTYFRKPLYLSEFADECAKNGFDKLLSFGEKNGCYITGDTFAWAAKNNHASILKQIDLPSMSVGTYLNFSSSPSLEMIGWAESFNFAHPPSGFHRVYAKRRDFQNFYKCIKVLFDAPRDNVSWSIDFDNLEILNKFINIYPIETYVELKFIYDNALRENSLEVVSWCFEQERKYNGRLERDFSSFSWQKLETMKIVYENSNEIERIKLLDQAVKISCSSANIDYLEYWFGRGAILSTEHIKDILKSDQQTRWYQDSLPFSDNKRKPLECVQFIHKKLKLEQPAILDPLLVTHQTTLKSLNWFKEVGYNVIYDAMLVDYLRLIADPKQKIKLNIDLSIMDWMCKNGIIITAQVISEAALTYDTELLDNIWARKSEDVQPDQTTIKGLLYFTLSLDNIEFMPNRCINTVKWLLAKGYQFENFSHKGLVHEDPYFQNYNKRCRNFVKELIKLGMPY